MTLSRDGQDIVAQIQVDILLLKARQICGDLEVVALVGDIGTEGVGEGPAKIGPGIIEEALFDFLDLAEGIENTQCMITIQHDDDLLYKRFGIAFSVPLGTIMILRRRCEQIQ